MYGMQLPGSWHWSGGPHTTGLPPMQLPLLHVSVCVQLLLSLHPLPSCLGG